MTFMVETYDPNASLWACVTAIDFAFKRNKGTLYAIGQKGIGYEKTLISCQSCPAYTWKLLLSK